MEIPENWQEELMLHDWKIMRIERCKGAFCHGAPWYHFPNGIRLESSTLVVDMERAPAVVAAISDWEPKMKVKKGVAKIQISWDLIAIMTEEEFDDFKWRIYSLDV